MSQIGELELWIERSHHSAYFGNTLWWSVDSGKSHYEIFSKRTLRSAEMQGRIFIGDL